MASFSYSFAVLLTAFVLSVILTLHSSAIQQKATYKIILSKLIRWNSVRETIITELRTWSAVTAYNCFAIRHYETSGLILVPHISFASTRSEDVENQFLKKQYRLLLNVLKTLLLWCMFMQLHNYSYILSISERFYLLQPKGFVI